MKWLETSAKTNTNVAEAFSIMAKEIIAQSLEKEKTMKKGKLIKILIIIFLITFIKS